MAITLVTALDVNGVIQAAGNTFADLTYANTYFDQRPNSSAWTNLNDDEDKKKLLLWAMRSLNALGWIGGLLEVTQPLSWPRVAIRPIERSTRRQIRTGFETLTGATSGLYDLRGRFWPSNAIPAPVKNAQCEQAIAAQQSTLWTASSQFKRRIIQNAQGLIEYKTGGSDSGSMAELASTELSGFLLTGAGVSLLARA
jgi:hypothetical protein